VPRGQRDGSLRPYSRISRPEPLLLLPSSSSIVLTTLSGPRSRITTSQKIWYCQESNPHPWISGQELCPLDQRGSRKWNIIRFYWMWCLLWLVEWSIFIFKSILFYHLLIDTESLLTYISAYTISFLQPKIRISVFFWITVITVTRSVGSNCKVHQNHTTLQTRRKLFLTILSWQQSTIMCANYYCTVCTTKPLQYNKQPLIHYNSIQHIKFLWKWQSFN
jgi:hypothetical protein